MDAITDIELYNYENMNISSILFGCLFATLFGALFHLLRGGSIRKFLLYQILSWIGFWVFDMLAVIFRINFLKVGTLYLGMACIGAIIVLIIGRHGIWCGLSDGKNHA